MGVKKKTSSQTIKGPKKLRNPKSGGGRAQNQAEPSELPDMRQLVWQVVAMIPKGKVASYGQIARLIGFPRHSRYVGSTLRDLPKGSKLPWYRVVNAQLRISQRGGGEQRQRRLLEREGVEFVGDRVARSQRWETD